MTYLKNGKKKNEFGLPPHANAEPHARLMKKLEAMTSHEIFLTMVDAGIYTKTGKLRKPYR